LKSLRTLVPRAWLRLPARTARLRLTLLFAGLFLLCGTTLLAIIYLFVGGSSAISVSAVAHRIPQARGTPPGATTVVPGLGINLPGVHQVVIAQHNADIDRLVAGSWVVLALATVGAAVLGWFAAGRVLRPVREITMTARTISAGNLHERLALTGPDDEFKQLGDTLDDLLGRLEASFEGQRRFVANASHELRTPLTLERTLLQVALADPDLTLESLRATCAELLGSQSEHERLLESLLTLTSSERALEHREPLDLASLTAEGIEASRAELESRGLELVAVLEPSPIAGDEALIRRLIANLLDNAVDHNVQGGRVEIRTEPAAEHILLSVRNTGVVIPPEATDLILEPFQRLGPRRADTEGHYGLGLSIVRAIATAHHATLTVRAPPHGGLAVTVSFPLAGQFAAPDLSPES
jgi:signal transduction histidine kinase